MGHNKSRAWYRTQLLGYTIGELHACHLIVRCYRCRDERHLPLSALVARYGAAPKLGDVVPRLRCRFSSCRSRRDLVRFLTRHESEPPGEVTETVLVGQGGE